MVNEFVNNTQNLQLPHSSIFLQ